MCALSDSVVCLQYVPGAKGGFFQTYVFFLFPPAHLVCHSPLCKYVPNLPYVYQNSNTPCFLGISTCACVLVVTSSPHHHRPSAIITAHPTSFHRCRRRLSSSSSSSSSRRYPPATIWLHISDQSHPKHWLHTIDQSHPKHPSPPLKSYVHHG